jgi:hypothetical protein
MADIVAIDHGMEKIELAQSRNFFGVAKLSRELPIFDFELFERFKLPDIETAAVAGWPDLLGEAADFSRESEAATPGPVSNQIEITREGQFQAPNFAALRAQTNVC